MDTKLTVIEVVISRGCIDNHCSTSKINLWVIFYITLSYVQCTIVKFLLQLKPNKMKSNHSRNSNETKVEETLCIS